MRLAHDLQGGCLENPAPLVIETNSEWLNPWIGAIHGRRVDPCWGDRPHSHASPRSAIAQAAAPGDRLTPPRRETHAPASRKPLGLSSGTQCPARGTVATRARGLRAATCAVGSTSHDSSPASSKIGQGTAPGRPDPGQAVPAGALGGGRPGRSASSSGRHLPAPVHPASTGAARHRPRAAPAGERRPPPLPGVANDSGNERSRVR